MRVRFGILVFPGSNCDRDALWAVREVLGQEGEFLWHQERIPPDRFDALILPGGFSYGDYLRAGALARCSPAVESVAEYAERGRLVLGICNGFQILTEAGLLPGALHRNDSLRFHCGWTHLRVENPATPFTSLCREGQVLRIPVAHGEGNYFADPDTLAELERRGQVVLRYATAAGEVTPAANPNGSVGNIAAILNQRGNVLGMMPHPERAVEGLLGSADGRLIFESMIRFLTA